MRLDSLLKSDHCTLVFEAGDDKVRVTCQSWDDAVVISARSVPPGRRFGQNPARLPRRSTGRVLNVELSGLADAGYGP